MTKYLKWLLVPAAVLPVAWIWYFSTVPARSGALESAVMLADPPISLRSNRSPGDTATYVADISLHTPEELDLLFGRIEELLERPRIETETPLVSLVLHGPEVGFFAFQNYEQYKNLVDRAAKLAALGAIDISICKTQMDSLGIAADEVPAFLRQVPYGPAEVKRLLESGHVYM